MDAPGLYVVLWNGNEVVCKWKLNPLNPNWPNPEEYFRMADHPSFDGPSPEDLRRILLSNVQISDSQQTPYHHVHHHGHRGPGTSIPPGLSHREHFASPASQYASGFGNQIRLAETPFGYSPARGGHPFPQRDRGQHHHGRGHFHGRGLHTYRQRGSHRGLFDWRGKTHQQTDSTPRSESNPVQGPVSVQNDFQPDRNMEAFFAQCMYLDRTAEVEIARVDISRDDVAARNTFRIKLEGICEEAIRSEYPQSDVRLHLVPYGSLVSGFATKGADIDVAVSISGSLQSPNFMRDLPRLLENTVLAAGHGARLLTRTRVPIIKICQIPPREIYDALVRERKKWNDLPENEKYPVATPVAKSTFDAKQAAPHHSVPIQTSLEYLHEFAFQKRAETDDFAALGKVYNRIAMPLLETGALDLSKACLWLVGNLPQSIQAIVREKMGFDLTSPPPNALDTIVGLLSSDLLRTTKQKAHSEKKDKPWLREKKLGPLDFPKTGIGILCDINFSNELAIHNSRLLYFYNICDPRVRPMVLFIKAWAKRRKINSAYSGTLSSYGYALMIIHFLMNIVRPPVLPNLQNMISDSPAPRRIIDGKWDVTFFDDENAIREHISNGKWTENKDPLGVLLRNFFQYYAQQGHQVIANGFNWTQQVISLRTPGGFLSKESKDWKAAKTTLSEDNVEVRQRYIFAIEDPFELDHNVARTVTHNGVVAIRDEFRRAWAILISVGYGGPNKNGELFDELVEPEVPGSPKDGEPSHSGNSSKTKAEMDQIEKSEGNTDAVTAATEGMAALSV